MKMIKTIHIALALCLLFYSQSGAQLLDVAAFCARYKITEAQFYGKEKIEGNLRLRGLQVLPAGFSPIVSGHVDLGGLTSLPEGFNPTVGGDLSLAGLKSLPAGFSLTVGRNLNLQSLRELPKDFNPKVGGSLNLFSLTSLPAGFNLTIGGDLGLEHLRSFPENFRPTVLGNIRFSRELLKITPPADFKPTLGVKSRILFGGFTREQQPAVILSFQRPYICMSYSVSLMPVNCISTV